MNAPVKPEKETVSEGAYYNYTKETKTKLIDLDAIKDEIRELIASEAKSAISSICENHQNEQPVENNDILDDVEVMEIVNELDELSNTVFADIPLNTCLSKKFMWNIPRWVYDYHIAAKEGKISALYDPIALLYLFCIDDPENENVIDDYLSIITSKMAPVLSSNEYMEYVDDEELDEELDEDDSMHD